MRSLTPPLHLLRAFVTVERFGSVTRAAAALHLSQSAVSKQLQELESACGVRLFERVRRRLSPTPAAQRYAQLLRPLLAQLESATLDVVTGPASGGALHLSSLPTFGAKWLIPRLPAFQALHPQIALHFVPYVHGYDFSRAELDCSILFGDGHWPGAEACYLTGRDVVLIAPPPAAHPHPHAPAPAPRLRQPRDIAGFALLQHVSEPHAWEEWCDAHGVRGLPGLNPLAGLQFDQFHSLIRAVSAGMGLALVPHCLVADDIATGVVCAPLPADDYRDRFGYYLCFPEARMHAPTLVQFRDWICAECAAAPV